jgi:parvulin-like peptidyl-prolyl isomerase
MSASTERKNRAAAIAAGTDKKTLAAKEAEEKARKSKRKWIIGSIAVILCIALVLFLSSPIMYRITTAETVGGQNYSPAEVNYFRATSKSTLSGYGYDTMANYFGQETADQLLENDVNSKLIRNTALMNYAKEQGISLSAAEKKAAAEATKTQMQYLRDGAKTNGVSLSTYMSYIFGAGVNENVIRGIMEENSLTSKAMFSKFLEMSYSPEELTAFYEDPVDGDLFSYATYLVTAEEGADPAEAKTAAEALVAGFQDGYDGEADLITAFNDLLAEDFPEASATERTNILGSDLEADLRDWLVAEERQAGDVTAVEAENGWTVVLFREHSDNSQDTVSVRHILIMAEADENGVYTDEAKAAAKAKAEEILAAFQAGEQSEAEFAVLASLYSEDSGSSGAGGLYTGIEPGQMVPEFDEFCFADHNYGDTGIVYGDNGGYAGYHIMFYVGRMSARDANALDNLRGDAMNDWLTELTAGMERSTRWAYKFVG